MEYSPEQIQGNESAADLLRRTRKVLEGIAHEEGAEQESLDVPKKPA